MSPTDVASRDDAPPESIGGNADQFADLKPADALARLKATPDGLTSDEAHRRLAVVGPNGLAEERVPLCRRLFAYFWGPIPWMIEIAGILAAANGDWRSFAVIIAMLIINGGIGFWQERSAGDALDALKRQLALRARVRRDGEWTQIDAACLVPGDIVQLRLGDVVPADIKLVEGDYLSIDQSALTGESLPVTKGRGEVAYSSTLIKEGETVGVVCATGAETFFGRTAKLVESAGAVSHFQHAVRLAVQLRRIGFVSYGLLIRLLLLPTLPRGNAVTLDFARCDCVRQELPPC